MDSKLLARGDPSILSLQWERLMRLESAKNCLRRISQKVTKRLKLKTNNNDNLRHGVKAEAERIRADTVERVNK